MSGDAGSSSDSSDTRPPRRLRAGLANWQVRRVTAYMLAHLDGELSLDELSKLVNLSRTHFCTAFRLTVGHTPREWLIGRRLERARELLGRFDMSITEIALALGYTPSAFGAIFRERVGVTPSEFRRRL